MLLYVALGGVAGFLFNALFFVALTRAYPEAVASGGDPPAGIAISAAIGFVLCPIAGVVIGGSRAVRRK